jgi:hypothetical protein
MTSVDVGDAVELTFATASGADVVYTWLDPDQQPVLEDQPVLEAPTGSGRFPVTFLPGRAGTWTATFTAAGAATAVERYYIRASALTGPPPLAVVGDVAEQYGSLTPAQEGLASALLRAASKMIRARFPAIDTQIAAGSLDPDVVALGPVNMVLRVLRNPNGLRAETVGPFSKTYDTSAAAGQLVLTDDDAALFTPTAVLAAATIGVGTIRVTPGLAPPLRRCGYGGWRL